MEEGATKAGRDPAQLKHMIEIKVSYDRDADWAQEACRPWAALALSGDEKSGIEDPIEMEKAGDAAADRAHTRFIVSDDPDEVVERIARLRRRHGFTELVFHFPGDDQQRQIDAFTTTSCRACGSAGRRGLRDGAGGREDDHEHAEHDAVDHERQQRVRGQEPQQPSDRRVADDEREHGGDDRRACARTAAVADVASSNSPLRTTAGMHSRNE